MERHFKIYLKSYKICNYFCLIVSATCGAVLMVVAMLGCLLKEYLTKQRGEYETNEAKDMSRYDNADTAVTMSKTGQPEISQKKEWFI